MTPITTIKLHALRERIKRMLARQGLVLRAQGWERGTCGTYVVWQRVDGKTTREIAVWDLIAYAREIGAMKHWEHAIVTLLDDEGREVLPPVGVAPAALPSANGDAGEAAVDEIELTDEELDAALPDMPS